MRPFFTSATLTAVLVGAAGLARCGSGDTSSNFDSGTKDVTTGNDSPFVQPDTGPTVFNDFPTNPIIDPTLPSNIAMQFGSPDAGVGMTPCIAEPASDAMIPKNWTPLFMEYGSPAANVFEIRLTVDNQTGQELIYTPNTTYVIDQTTWAQLALHSNGHDLTISVRAGTLAGGGDSGLPQTLTGPPTPEATSTVHIAPVNAPGSVVYWSSTDGTAFRGFTVGDMTSKTVLTPATASPASAGDGTTTCISCHTDSPDGTYIVYTRDATNGSRAVDVRSVVDASTPAQTDISTAALAILGRDHQGAPILNSNHYSSTDAVAVSVLYNPTATGSPNYQLVWTDLHAVDGTGWGVMARTNDPNVGITSPAWRHDGTAITYVSATSSGEAVIANGPVMDLYTVPYNNRAGGVVTAFPGASDPAYNEFYPTYSPNDTILAFNRTDNTVPSSYNQPAAEVFIVPGSGGTAQRLRANDPPVCTTLTSPGLTNAWPRWAPAAQPSGSFNYYWVIFSSKRRPATGLNPQLYVAAIVTQVTGSTETIYADYPGVYVLSQDATQNNHTPAWDNFDVMGIPN